MEPKVHANDVEVLFSQEQLERRISELASEISRDFTGQDLVIVCVLKGAFLFAADLCRKLTIECSVDFITAASYVGKESSGDVKISAGTPIDYKDKTVLLIEDIVDTGQTVKKLMEYYRSKSVEDVKVASLLSKKAHRKHELKVDYVGFEVDDTFVVGYGLDYNQRFRTLPFIGKLNS